MTSLRKTGLTNPTPNNVVDVVSKLVQIVDQLQGVRGDQQQRAVRVFEIEAMLQRLGNALVPVGQSPGVNDGSYVHMQASAAETWIINHNLNRRVSVSVYTTGGVEMLSEIVTVNFNQARVRHDSPRSGYAVVQ